MESFGYGGHICEYTGSQLCDYKCTGRISPVVTTLEGSMVAIHSLERVLRKAGRRKDAILNRRGRRISSETVPLRYATNLI